RHRAGAADRAVPARARALPRLLAGPRPASGRVAARVAVARQRQPALGGQAAVPGGAAGVDLCDEVRAEQLLRFRRRAREPAAVQGLEEAAAQRIGEEAHRDLLVPHVAGAETVDQARREEEAPPPGDVLARAGGGVRLDLEA